MFNLSEDYHLRKCFLQRDQVPTQSMMKEKMSPALALIYFESMSPKLRVIAGLEPKLKGGGNNWYVPPEELLKGRSVLKPIRKQTLSKLNSVGVETFGKTLFQKHREAMNLEIEQALLDSDNEWRNNIRVKTSHLWNDLVAAATKKNTETILKDFDQFSYLYRQSIGKIEILFHESAIAEIKNTRENAILAMKNKYTTVLKHQATLLYDEYEKKLNEEKARLKIDFMKDLEIKRTSMTDKIHDLNVDKHMAIASVKKCLQCQNLACRVYVALKEREEFSKEAEMLEQKHNNKVGIMADIIQMKDFEIRLAKEKEKRRQEFSGIWRKKVCRVVKAFQMFVSYCLNMLPEHAEFFINMEKLMLLQLNETVEDPTAPSIIEDEKVQFHTPVSRPKPFYLCCDRGYKADVEENLCPKHSGTSSATEMPVIIVNKRCLYAACYHFEFNNKMKEFIHGNRGDDSDFEDDNVYEHFLQVKYGPSQQRLEIKLESSLLQILQQEVTNIDVDKVPAKCQYCGLPWCHPCPDSGSPSLSVSEVNQIKLAYSSITSSEISCRELQLVSKSVRLGHEAEPKWQSFCRHVEPKQCICAKTAKKHLEENLPVYMRHMKYGPPEIPGYEMCSIEELKSLVKGTRKAFNRPVLTALPPRFKDMSTQYCDPLVEEICTCFSDDTLSKFIDNMQGTAGPEINFSTMSPSFMTRRISTFATSRAQSLRNLVKDLSELHYIFSHDDCDFV